MGCFRDSEHSASCRNISEVFKEVRLGSCAVKTVQQMGDIRFSPIYLTYNRVRVVYRELCEKLEGHGENWRIDAISLEVLNFLVKSLRPIYA